MISRPTLALAAAMLVATTLTATAQDRTVRDVKPRHEPYRLDDVAFAKELEKTRNEPQRRSVLERRWAQVQYAVAYYRATDNARFSYSFAYWRTGWLQSGDWSIATIDLVEPLAEPGIETVLIQGDCFEDITIPDVERALVHVYGDLHGTITVGDNSEVVIAGDLLPEAAVQAASGRVDLFVGGDVHGALVNDAALSAWVHGDFDGELRAGAFRTAVAVHGDFTGTVLPPPATKDQVRRLPLSLILDVRGTMPARRIQAAARLGFRSFLATVGGSDHAPGIFMEGETTGAGPQSLWVVRERHSGEEGWIGADYRLDAAVENLLVEGASTPAQRLEALAVRWERIATAVLHHRAADDPSFHYSDRLWRHGHLLTGAWSRVFDDLSNSIYDPEVRTVLVRGDCRADIVIPASERAIVHIYGDLHGTVSVGKHSEVVIGGDIKRFGRVEANGDGFVDVFVGGDIEGAVQSERYVSTWVHGNVEGEIQAGAVCTNLVVLGDLTGVIRTLPESRKLRLDVRGFASIDVVESVRGLDIAYLLATFGSSDHPVGLFHRNEVDPPGLSSVLVVHRP